MTRFFSFLQLLARQALAFIGLFNLALYAVPVQAQAVQSPLITALNIYNSRSDIAFPFFISDRPEDGGIDSGALPSWLFALPLTHQEAGAFAAAGVYLPLRGSAQRCQEPSVGSQLSNALSSAVAGATLYQGWRGQHNAPPTGQVGGPLGCPKPKPRAPAAPRFERFLVAFEACPGAFASLAQKIITNKPDSELAELMRYIRTDRIEFAVHPDPTCSQVEN